MISKVCFFVYVFYSSLFINISLFLSPYLSVSASHVFLLLDSRRENLLSLFHHREGASNLFLLISLSVSIFMYLSPYLSVSAFHVFFFFFLLLDSRTENLLSLSHHGSQVSPSRSLCPGRKGNRVVVLCPKNFGQTAAAETNKEKDKKRVATSGISGVSGVCCLAHANIAKPFIYTVALIFKVV